MEGGAAWGWDGIGLGLGRPRGWVWGPGGWGAGRSEIITPQTFAVILFLNSFRILLLSSYSQQVK